MGTTKRKQFLLSASVFAALAAASSFYVIDSYFKEQHPYTIIPSVLIAAACLLVTILCLDIWQQNPADSHTFRTLYSQYRWLLLLRLKAPYIRWLIKSKTMDAKKTSKETLLRILRMNQDTVYGKEYKFRDMKSREDFAKGHPLTTHEHYVPYLDRIQNGEKDILHYGKSMALITTSGTTGAPKVWPRSERHTEDFRFITSQMCSLSYIHLLNLQRYALFWLFNPVSESTGNIPIGRAMQFSVQVPPHNLIPKAYSRLLVENASYYAQAVFSLAERELRYISSYSPDIVFFYWRFITINWEHICEDIANGYIGEHISMPEDVKMELSGHLKSDPARALELCNAIKCGTVGLAKRIWPDMKFVLMAKEAAFKLSATALMEDHLQGLEVLDATHAASEGFLGFIFSPSVSNEEEGFTSCLFPTFYTEYIPLEYVGQDQPQTVFPEKVKVGHLYEIVVTNPSGQYRTRFGDIVKIIGFTNGTPKYKLMYRLGQRLSISYERTPDAFLIKAISCETKNLLCGSKLVNFTSTESMHVDKLTGEMSVGHYVFFLEFDNDTMVDCEDIATKVDLALSELYSEYKYWKETMGSIGPIEVMQVKSGSFDGLKSFLLNGAPHIDLQFKLPRVLRKEPALRYLLDQVLQE